MMPKMTKYQIQSIEEITGLSFEESRECLRKILEEHGVSKENCEDWLNWSNFYYELLDKDGNLSARGADFFEYWRNYLGDPIKEMTVERYALTD